MNKIQRFFNPDEEQEENAIMPNVRKKNGASNSNVFLFSFRFPVCPGKLVWKAPVFVCWSRCCSVSAFVELRREKKSKKDFLCFRQGVIIFFLGGNLTGFAILYTFAVIFGIAASVFGIKIQQIRSRCFSVLSERFSWSVRWINWRKCSIRVVWSRRSSFSVQSSWLWFRRSSFVSSKSQRRTRKSFSFSARHRDSRFAFRFHSIHRAGSLKILSFPIDSAFFLFRPDFLLDYLHSVREVRKPEFSFRRTFFLLLFLREMAQTCCRRITGV